MAGKHKLLDLSMVLREHPFFMLLDLVGKTHTLGTDNSNDWRTSLPEDEIEREQFLEIDADSAFIPSDLGSACSKKICFDIFYSWYVNCCQVNVSLNCPFQISLAIEFRISE